MVEVERGGGWRAARNEVVGNETTAQRNAIQWVAQSCVLVNVTHIYELIRASHSCSLINTLGSCALKRQSERILERERESGGEQTSGDKRDQHTIVLMKCGQLSIAE